MWGVSAKDHTTSNGERLSRTLRDKWPEGDHVLRALSRNGNPDRSPPNHGSDEGLPPERRRLATP